MLVTRSDLIYHRIRCAPQFQSQTPSVLLHACPSLLTLTNLAWHQYNQSPLGHEISAWWNHQNTHWSLSQSSSLSTDAVRPVFNIHLIHLGGDRNLLYRIAASWLRYFFILQMLMLTNRMRNLSWHMSLSSWSITLAQRRVIQMNIQ